MDSMYFLYIFSIVCLLFSCYKLFHLKTVQEIKCFDQDITLPLRGLLSIIIVIHHLGLTVFLGAGASVVSMFFFISGYGLVISFKKKGDLYLKNFLPKRFIKVLPSFLILTILMCLYKFISENKNIKEIVHDLIFKGNTPLPNSWYIYVIIYQYIAFYYSCKVGRTLKRSVIIASILTILAMVIMYVIGYGACWWISMPSFISGMILGLEEFKLKSLLIKYKVIIISIIISIIIILTFISNLCVWSLFIFANLFPIVIMCFIYSYGFINNKVLRYLGKISLEIYLVHGIVLLYKPPINLHWITILGFVIIVTVIIATIFNKINGYIKRIIKI